MSIGKQRIGMMFMNFRTAIVNGAGALHTSGEKSISALKPYNQDGISAENLPRAPHSVYRKRPVKLVFDKNDFHMFRLPSEKNFLLGSYDYNDLFG